MRKEYSFTFDEIVSVVRQVKKNKVKSERLIIKTCAGKKLIVENAEISYDRFKKVIISKDSEPELRDQNTVYLQITEERTEEELISVAKRMMPDEIIIEG